MTDTFTDTPGTPLTAHTPELGGPITMNFGLPDAVPTITPSGALAATVGSSNAQYDYAAPIPAGPWSATVTWTIPPTYEDSRFQIDLNDPAGLAATAITWLAATNHYQWDRQDDAGNASLASPPTAHTAGDTWTFTLTWDGATLTLADNTGPIDSWTPISTFTPTTVSIRAVTPADPANATILHSITLTTP